MLTDFKLRFKVKIESNIYCLVTLNDYRGLIFNKDCVMSKAHPEINYLLAFRDARLFIK